MLLLLLLLVLFFFVFAGANPLATDANGLVPCEKHIAGGRQDMKRLLEVKAFQGARVNVCISLLERGQKRDGS